MFETLPAHVARIGFLAHPQSLHQSGKIVNRFLATSKERREIMGLAPRVGHARYRDNAILHAADTTDLLLASPITQ